MNAVGLAKRLEAKFGTGEKPLISRRLYRRLEREAVEFGEDVHAIITEVVQCAFEGKDNPGVWFRASISARLRESGFLVAGSSENKRRVIGALGARLAQALPSIEGV